MVIYKSFTPATDKHYGGTLLIITCLLVNLSMSTLTAAADDFYTLDHTFVFTGLKDCKDNEYYDPVQFACKRCESSFNLVPSKDSKCNSLFVVHTLVPSLVHTDNNSETAIACTVPIDVLSEDSLPY